MIQQLSYDFCRPNDRTCWSGTWCRCTRSCGTDVRAARTWPPTWAGCTSTSGPSIRTSSCPAPTVPWSSSIAARCNVTSEMFTWEFGETIFGLVLKMKNCFWTFSFWEKNKIFQSVSLWLRYLQIRVLRHFVVISDSPCFKMASFCRDILANKISCFRDGTVPFLSLI